MRADSTMRPAIRFGTDGWRAVIAEDFTFANVRRVARALAAYATRTVSVPLLTIGYDTRFQSRAFAEATAAELAAAGCRVIVSSRVLSTPAVSSSVLDEHAFGGIVISASHNPSNFNGFKFKSSHGCSAPEDITRQFEMHLEKGTRPQRAPVPGTIEYKDLTAAYWRRLKKAVDMSVIKRTKLQVIADPMHGAGAGYLSGLLQGGKAMVREIHHTPDPLFGGLHPEPIDPYLQELQATVRRSGADAGLATDGDADRIGVVDDQGRYLTPHQIFPLLLQYLCAVKKMQGKVVQAISLGYVSKRIADDYGLPFEETPVGFKYIAERIVRENILMGGEESGGYGYGWYLPERDGILNSLMILEMLAVTGKRLSVLVREVEKKYGASRYLREDFRNPGISKVDFVQVMKTAAPVKISGCTVREIKDFDGIEYVLADDSWLLLRPSGTEPIIRVYAESGDLEQTRKLIAWGKTAVANICRSLR